MNTRRLAAADLRGLGGRARIRRRNRPPTFYSPHTRCFFSRLFFRVRSVLFQRRFWRRADHGSDRGPFSRRLWVAAGWRFWELFWQGCLIGLVEISGLVGLIAAFGGYSFGDIALHGKEMMRWGILWAVFFVVCGLV